MSPKSTFFILLGLFILLLFGIGGGTYGFNILLQNQSKQLISMKLQDQVLSQQQVGLKKAKADIAKYTQLEKITNAVVPQDKNQAESVREIVNIASSSGVSLSNISFPASTLGSTTVSGAAVSPPASPGLATQPTPSQLLAVPNIPGVYKLQITLQNGTNSAVTYSELYNFLSQLEHNRRTAQVSSLVIQPSPDNPNLLTFILTLDEYIKP
ncbi:MAG TPA: hypothetical protein VNE40_02855 [Candidatus Dormibacteraeota bacterium]|nr:hypothetical protein [Candidatus Dormibacteraeota bacterium]